MLVLVVGPSGAGKDTLLNAACDALGDDPTVRFVRRVITRPAPRPGEADPEAFDAVDEQEFERLRDAGGFALWSGTSFAAPYVAGELLAHISPRIMGGALSLEERIDLLHEAESEVSARLAKAGPLTAR